jgi:hypothetical protein
MEIGEKRETIYFKTVNDWGFSHISEENDTEASPLQSLPLSDLIKEDVILLKIDVEGAEDKVWKGLEPVFETYKIDNIIVEVKQIGDIDYKRTWINRRIAQKYDVFSYSESYDANLPLYSFDDIPHQFVAQVEDWILHEDLWLSRQ